MESYFLLQLCSNLSSLFFFFLTTLCCTQDLSSLTRDQTHAPLHCEPRVLAIGSLGNLVISFSQLHNHKSVKLYNHSGKEPACQCGRSKRHGSDPWVRKIPWRRAWQRNPAFLPGESSWTKEPGGLQSMGSQRVRQDWNDLARMHPLTQKTVYQDTKTQVLTETPKDNTGWYLHITKCRLYTF